MASPARRLRAAALPIPRGGCHALLPLVALLDAEVPVPVVLLTVALPDAPLVPPVGVRDAMLIDGVLFDEGSNLYRRFVSPEKINRTRSFTSSTSAAWPQATAVTPQPASGR